MKPLQINEVYKFFGGYKMKVPIDIPDQSFGKWEIKSFTVTQEDYDRMVTRNAINPKRGGWRIVPVGTYKKLSLVHSFLNDPMMSNTPDEIRDQADFVAQAHGNVLVNGLGLGVTLKMLFLLNRVDHVTVIEKDGEVFDVVGSYYKKEYGDKLTIIHADALEWKPAKGVKYQAVWHDIWPAISSDNLKDMKKLHRKYGRRTNWQGSWCREMVEQQRSLGY